MGDAGSAIARQAILAMKHPLPQRYAFCRYILGEPRRDAFALALHFEPLGLLDGTEYNYLAAHWDEP